MDQVLLDRATKEAIAAFVAKGLSSDRAEQRVQMMIPSAIKCAEVVDGFTTYSVEEKVAYRAGFFTKLGVSQETANSLAATM